jgi:ketosteroid isomerase-like protein
MSGAIDLRRAHRIAIFCSIALVLLAAGCESPATADTRAADERTLRDLDARWSRTAGAKDLDGAVAFYSDEAVLLPPNDKIAADKASIRASWAGLLGAADSISWQVDRIEVARSGDLAYLSGTYALTLKVPQGKPIADRGKFLEVWTRQPGGQWKAVADTYNSDLPASAPAPMNK